MKSHSAKRFSSGIVPIYKDGPETFYLLLRSYNYWDFPKGEVEQNEDPFKAARRELQEYRWVNFENAKQLLGDRVAAILDWANSVSKK